MKWLVRISKSDPRDKGSSNDRSTGNALDIYISGEIRYANWHLRCGAVEIYALSLSAISLWFSFITSNTRSFTRTGI